MKAPEFYVDEAGEHRWRVVAANGKLVAASSQGFAKKGGATRNYELVLGLEPGAAALKDQPPFAVRALELDADGLPRGLLAGRRMLPREVATLMHGQGWLDLGRLVDGVATMFAESAGYTEAVGGPNPNGTLDLGFMQLNSGHAAAAGLTAAEFREMAFDPARAVVFGRKLYVSAGYRFSPWYAFTNGTYKRHLAPATGGVANFWAERLGLEPVPHFQYA